MMNENKGKGIPVGDAPCHVCGAENYEDHDRNCIYGIIIKSLSE